MGICSPNVSCRQTLKWPETIGKLAAGRRSDRVSPSDLPPYLMLFVVFSAAVAGLLLLAQTTGLAAAACIPLGTSTRPIHIIHGKFSGGISKATYCFSALAGQHVLINIKPSGNLNTEGYVQFLGPPGKSDWSPGSPGGIVFNEELPWKGKYLLVVGQRFNEKKAGGFTVEISGK